MDKIENSIEALRRSFDPINKEFIELYVDFKNENLQEVFSTLHEMVVRNLSSLNMRLPTSNGTAHFWADPSRELLKAIEDISDLKENMKSGPYNFKVDDYYEEVFERCEIFLKQVGGSLIPPNMEKIEIYYTIPIFLPMNRDTIKKEKENKSFNLKLIGEGSYANVFKFKDDFYNKNFVLKRAKKELSEKELARFKLEYDETKKFSSPYIVEVFKYFDETNEYVMEYMDFTLGEYILKNNQKLNISVRKNIINQILRAFKYIHSKDRYHRDISPENILIKLYDDVIVVKISDFGLMKIPNSSLTSWHTEFKGAFNDPGLATEGFGNYSMEHEIYALTRIVYYVLTGKRNLIIQEIKDERIRKFVEGGVNPSKAQRYKSVDEIWKKFNDII